jgi:hypothetical protein
VKALAEIGWRRALRFGLTTAAMLPYRLLLVPQLRAPSAPAGSAHTRRHPMTSASSTCTEYSAGLEIGEMPSATSTARPGGGITLEAR